MSTKPKSHLRINRSLFVLWGFILVLVAGSFMTVAVSSPVESTSASNPFLRKVASKTMSTDRPLNTFDCSQVTQIPRAECQALVDFYQSTNGDNWERKDNWLVTTTPCDWYRITCSETLPAHVHRLEIWLNSVSGTISESIGSLRELRVLNLTGNYISGRLPNSIGKLTKLEELGLYHNMLSGPLPASIGTVGKQGQIHHLNRLDIGLNNFYGDIPAQFGDLSGIRDLYLSHNRFTGVSKDNIVNTCRVLGYHNPNRVWWQTQINTIPSDPCAGVPTGVPAMSRY